MWKHAATLLLLLSSIPITAQMQPPKGHQHPALPQAPYTDQEIDLLFAGQSANEHILLTLNNNRPLPLDAKLTIYFTDGSAHDLPVVNLVASESKLIDLSQFLRDQNLVSPIGYAKVYYSGRIMELGAQLTLYPVEGKGGLDSPRSLSVDFVDNDREAVAWKPKGATPVLALTNVSNSSITVHLDADGEHQEVEVPAHATTVQEPQETPIFGSPLRRDIYTVSATYEGPKDALRVFGYLKSPLDGSLPIRIYDPKGSTTTVLAAPGLVLGRETHVTVRNVTKKPQLLKGRLTEIGAETPKSKELPPILVPPGTAFEIEVGAALHQLGQQNVTRASLFIESVSDKGAFIGTVTQTVSEGLLEDIPLRTGNPQRFMRGAYPLRWENDYTNRPTIVNTAATAMEVRAYVIAGGTTYTFPVKTVQPGATLDYDVDSIRQQGTVDINGKKIPTSALYGKFHWSPVAGVTKPGLIGRTELMSATANRASSFSCGFMCDYEWDTFPGFDGDWWDPYNTPGTTNARSTSPTEYVQDSYGNNTGDYPIQTSKYGGVSSANTSILSYQDTNNQYTLQADTGTPGGTNAAWHYYVLAGQQSEDGSYCTYPDYGSDQNPPQEVHPTVSVSGSSQVALAADGTTGAQSSIQLTATSTPSGGTYSWSSSNTNVSLANSSSSVVTVNAASAGSSNVTVTYTLNGETAQASQTVTVQQPGSLGVIADSGNMQTASCTSGATLAYHGVTRNLVYQVKDTTGASITIDGLPATETLTEVSSSCASDVPITGSTTTQQGGKFGDTFNFCNSSCLPADANLNPTGQCTRTMQQVGKVNGYTVLNRQVVYTCTSISPN